MSSYNNSLIDDLKREFSGGSMVNRLIITNLAVFLGIIITKILTAGLFQSPVLFDSILANLGVPYDLMRLLTRPWTLLTYMFVHTDFFHIIFNLLWLWWFGKIFLQFANNRNVLPLYILGGLSGAGFYIIMFFLFPNLASGPYMIGASAGVTAIVVATATMRPNYEILLVFLGAVKIKYIALAHILFDLFSVANQSNTGGHLAHLGGAALGFLFAKQLMNGNDIGAPLNRLFDRISGWVSPAPVEKPKPKVVYRRKVKSPRQYQAGKKKEANMDRQARVDAILDRIKEVGGYDNLSAEEKEFLFKASRED